MFTKDARLCRLVLLKVTLSMLVVNSKNTITYALLLLVLIIIVVSWMQAVGVVFYNVFVI